LARSGVSDAIDLSRRLMQGGLYISQRGGLVTIDIRQRATAEPAECRSPFSKFEDLTAVRTRDLHRPSIPRFRLDDTEHRTDDTAYRKSRASTGPVMALILPEELSPFPVLKVVSRRHRPPCVH
jgi:hypothetical protein